MGAGAKGGGLEKVKMTNLEYLENLRQGRETRFSSSRLFERDIELRKMNALEIIAEELIKCNTYLAYIKLKGIKRG